MPVCHRFLKAKTVLCNCRYLFNARIKSDYVAIFVTWSQSLNCLFYVGIAILDMGRAGGRVVRKKVWSFLSRKLHVSGKFSAPFLSHSVSCTEGKLRIFECEIFKICYLCWSDHLLVVIWFAWMYLKGPFVKVRSIFEIYANFNLT